MATKGHKSRNRIKILKTSVVGRCLFLSSFRHVLYLVMTHSRGQGQGWSLIGHGGGHLTPAWPIRNSPGTFWPASLGKIPTLSQACQVVGMWIWACLCPYSCSLACVPIRLKWTRANNVSESLDVLKLIAPSDFCYPTQWILLSLKKKKKFKCPGQPLGSCVMLMGGADPGNLPGENGVHQHWHGVRTTTQMTTQALGMWHR